MTVTCVDDSHQQKAGKKSGSEEHERCDSISMKFKPGETTLWQGASRGVSSLEVASGVREMCWVLTWLLVKGRVHFVKTHQAVYLRLVYFSGSMVLRQ